MRLIILKAPGVDAWILPKDPELFNRRLQQRVARANKLFMLEPRPEASEELRSVPRPMQRRLREGADVLDLEMQELVLQQCGHQACSDGSSGSYSWWLVRLQKQLDFIFPEAVAGGRHVRWGMHDPAFLPLARAVSGFETSLTASEKVLRQCLSRSHGQLRL